MLQEKRNPQNVFDAQNTFESTVTKTSPTKTYMLEAGEVDERIRHHEEHSDQRRNQVEFT